MTKKVLLAAAMLLCFGSVAMAKAPKAKITFEKGTTVTINGQPAKSGATIKPGDKVSVQGGEATLKVGGQTTALPAGSSVSESADGAITATGANGVPIVVNAPAPAPVSTATQAAPAKTDTNSGGNPPPPPPPNPSQNAAVAPVSGSAP